MNFRVQCRNCGAGLVVPSDPSGCNVDCPKCHTTTHVPIATESPSIPPSPQPRAHTPQVPERQSDVLRRYRRRRSPVPMIVGIVSGTVGVAAVVAVAVYFLNTDSMPGLPGSSPPSVTVEWHTAEEISGRGSDGRGRGAIELADESKEEGMTYLVVKAMINEKAIVATRTGTRIRFTVTSKQFAVITPQGSRLTPSYFSGEEDRAFDPLWTTTKITTEIDVPQDGMIHFWVVYVVSKSAANDGELEFQFKKRDPIALTDANRKE